MTRVLSLIYRIVISLVAIYLPFRFRKLDRASRIIGCLTWLGAITEAIGYMAAKYYRTNYVVFNIAFYPEFALMALYYNYSLPALWKRKLGIYIAEAGVVLGILNNLLFQPLKTSISSNLLFLECIMVLCLSLFSILKLVTLDRENFHLHRKVHFWFPCILLFYQSATLSSWGLYDKLGDDETEKGALLDIIVLLINIITYLSYGLVFALYPKLKLVGDEH